MKINDLTFGNLDAYLDNQLKKNRTAKFLNKNT